MKQIIMVYCMALVLVGCASTSGKELANCATADWPLVGAQDAMKGLALSRFEQYKATCAAANAENYMSDYGQGYAKGLQVYCTQDNGFALGQKGKVYNNICPKTLEPAFLAAYEEGKVQYDSLKREQDVALERLKRRADRLNDALGGRKNTATQTAR